MKIGVITKNPGKRQIVEYVFPKYELEINSWSQLLPNDNPLSEPPSLQIPFDVGV